MMDAQWFGEKHAACSNFPVENGARYKDENIVGEGCGAYN